MASASTTNLPSNTSNWLPTPAAFRQNKRGNAELKADDPSFAQRRRPDENKGDCVLYTNSPVPSGQLWQITVCDKSKRWSIRSGLSIGMTTTVPSRFPYNLSKMNVGSHDWICIGREFINNKSTSHRNQFPSLTNQQIGLLVTSTGQLHLYLNGKYNYKLSDGIFRNNKPVPVWGIVDLCGVCTKIKSEVLSDDENITDERAKQLYERALESGSFEQRKLIVSITGLMGSGKTCLLSRLLEQNPPKYDKSTGLAEFFTISVSEKSWKLLGNEDMLRHCAFQCKRNISEESIPALATNIIASEPNDPNPLLPAPSSIKLDSSSTSSMKSFPKEPPLLKTRRIVIDFIKSTNASNNTMLKLVHMSDTGGQPEIMEVMPSVIHNANFIILVINLMNDLDEHPQHSLRDQGIEFNKPSFQYTSKQMILKLASTLHAKEFCRTFHILVVATHPDCVDNLAARVESLDKALKDLLFPSLEGNLILFKAPDKIAHVVNLKNPDDNDNETLLLIRTEISDDNNFGKVLKTPNSFLAFEDALRNHADNKERYILTMNECQKIGKELKMGIETVKAALIYLHQQNTFLYFQQFLSNIIFIKPEIVLHFVNNIVLFSYKVHTRCLRGFPAKYVSLLKDGKITEEMLGHSELSSKYIPGMFEARHVIRLLCYNFTIAQLRKESSSPTSDTEYLMMCLLPAIPDHKVREYIPSSCDTTLIVRFSNGCVPLGCFSSMISCLLSKYDWNVCRKSGKPECLAHNIALLLDYKLPVSILLIDTTHQIEIHVIKNDGVSNDMEDIINIRMTVFSAIRKVFDIMRLTEILIKPAVFCPCDEKRSHHATLEEGRKFLRCSMNESRVIKVSQNEQQWIDNGITVSGPPNLVQLLKLIPLQVGSCYKKFGVCLLNDKTGYQVDTIASGLAGDGEKIVEKILQKWVASEEKKVNWKNLIKALKYCDLNSFAETIRIQPSEI